MTEQFDDAVVQCFLEKQEQLLYKKVFSTKEEARDFLEEGMAVVVSSVKEVREFFEEEGLDTEGLKGKRILEADEVFEVGDGRYLIVEA
ncbi:MAG: glyoxalase [Lachnospiraceae bacterium]|nr:glyoxalase [Lachnospiraceae bacterium]